MNTKTVVTVVGARPQFIKASAVSREFARRSGIVERILHTGQHYDAELSDVFFTELGIPAPAHHLGVGSGSHGAQTAHMLEGIEKVLLAERPAAVLVYGDTNSTLAGALAAAKLHIPVAHVEAGLRSFNRRMPEELNRVMTDHLATLLHCPTHLAVAHLAREGITHGVHHVGDVMCDVSLEIARRAEESSPLRNSGLPDREFVLATVHRAENTDDPKRLEAIFAALSSVGAERTVVFPVHPRTRAVIEKRGLSLSRVKLMEPVGLVDMTWLERHAALIVTDSGGVQKEAYFHRTPCVTVRTETEWVETVSAGWNRLADPADAEAITSAINAALRGPAPTGEIAEYGTGAAAAKVVDTLLAVL
ncbi:MAG: UDP-N-acetylglucosamine 2-epimerase (non-hydrolyzing) [Archangium sp.]|nr:UDP-N-acetylglucosamine 2-epimerase (non-hydrolyzing) [Archangium sp.]